MQRILSTYLFVHQKLTSALLSDIAEAGFTGVEIFCDRMHFDYQDAQWVRHIAAWFGEHGLQLHSLHAPTSRDKSATRQGGTPISISDTERVRRLDAVDEVKRAIEVAELIPCQFLVQHLGASREAADPRRYDAAFNSLEHLAIFAGQRGLTIALENTPGGLASPGMLRQFIADTRLTSLRLCFDTGHAHMEDGVERSFEKMRDLVATAHVHDNAGERDDHLLPYAGSIDWNAALAEMAVTPSAPNGLPLVLELREAPGQAIELGEALAVYDRFEQARAQASGKQ
jgi:sugar phosphate isomerase/epimerase